MELVFDCETTIFEKGNPFARRNRLCYVGVFGDGNYSDYPIEYSDAPYGRHLQHLQGQFDKATLVVGFNLKFDLHWIRRYGVNLRNVRVWDCQLAEFILSHQKLAYPSLDEACSRRGLGNKLDVVSSEYWDNGIDTPDVPEQLLKEYLAVDVSLTQRLYEAQLKIFLEGDPKLFNLFKLQCEDLLVLAEMEWNGMLFNTDKAKELSDETSIKLEGITKQLSELVDAPAGFNWNSDDHVSTALYGGDLYLPGKVPTERTLKDGTVKRGEKNGWVRFEYGRLVVPPDRSETKPTAGMDNASLRQFNEGRPKPIVRVYSVSEPTLRGLRCTGKARRLIQLLLERSNLEKLNSTYYLGIPKVMTEKDWPPNMVHGQLNQCVARTGRLSASSPNQQNYSGDIKPLFYSRYN